MEVVVRRSVFTLNEKDESEVMDEPPLKKATSPLTPEPETEPEPIHEVPIAKQPEEREIP